MSTSTIEQAVKSQYGAVARSTLTNDTAGVRAVAEAFGYSAGDLAGIPAEANMGLSCGNPIAAASLKPGEVVVDLGSGGGLDVFLAAQRVGPTGKAIGIDMTPAMIDRARAAAARGVNGKPITNVEFHLSGIDKLPLTDGSVDCVISNCVINLAEDKQAVFREIARVLKPGGRLAVSDIALKKPLPPALADSISGYVGCISGAIAIAEYEAGLRDAGFQHVQVIDSGADLNAYAKVENQSGCCSPAMAQPAAAGASCCTPSAADTASTRSLPLASTGCCSAQAPTVAPGDADTVHSGLADLLSKHDVNSYAASVKVFAVKPTTPG